MSTGPWSVKGIDPRAREAAKSAARRAGMTLGEWLNHRLMNDAAPEALESARFTAPGALSLTPRGGADLQDAIEELAERLEAAERRSTLAITGIDQSVLGLLTRLEGTEKTFETRTSTIEDMLKTLEGMVTRSSAEVEQALRKMDRNNEDLARRMDTMAEHTAVQLERVRQDLSKELELVNNRSDELSQRLGAAERMTDNAVRTLEASFAAIDERLRQAEQSLRENGHDGLADTFNRRFRMLSEELTEAVAQTRSQLAAQIEAQAANPRLDQLESGLERLRARLAKTERRHAKTLQRIAGEVGKLGGVLEQRLAETERHTAMGLDQLLDARFRSFQNEHAAAIDKIGEGLSGAIARLENKLDEVETQHNSKEDLEARIAAAEERTARMIEEAMARIEQRLAAEDADKSEDDSPVQKAMAALAERLEALENQSRAAPSFDPSALPAEAPPVIDAPEDNPVLEEILHPPGMQDQPPPLPPLPDPQTAEAGAQDMPPPAAAAPQETAFDPGFADTGAPDYPPAADPAAPVRAGATADASFIAAARRSVRAPGAGQPDEAAASPGPGRPGASRTILMAASILAIIAVLGAGSITLLDFGGKKEKATAAVSADGINWDAPADKTAADPAAGASADAAAAPAPAQNVKTASADAGEETDSAALDGAPPSAANDAGSAAADTAPQQGPAPAPARPAKRHQSQRSSAPQPAPHTSPAMATAPKAQPSTAVHSAALDAPAPQPAPVVIGSEPKPAPRGRQTITQAAAAGDPVALFQLASAKLDAGDGKEGVKLMRQAAERGLPIAQYRMGKIYEDGILVPKDEAAARRWTERAANGGNRRAMHNLAMLYAEGQGVPQSYEKAAKWFQQAALLGLTNSQYNLAFLYEQGLGVPESPEDAYVWYSIAAKAGDEGARKRAEKLAASLSPREKSEAQSQIAQYRPEALDLAANGVFNNVAWARPQLNTAASIARAQVLLARLGYKPGPADGNPGRSTRQAVIAYERDNGLAQTGRIDAALLARLEKSVVN